MCDYINFKKDYFKYVIFRLRSKEDKSGLFLFQVQPFSGFVISPEEQERNNRMALAMDFDNGLFNMYFSRVKQHFSKSTDFHSEQK